MNDKLTLLPTPVAPVTDQPIVVDELVLGGGTFGNFRLSDIRISRTNRKRFNEAKLQQLADSIKAKGVAQPILIRPVTPTEAEPQPYEIVAGERRFRASIMAGAISIPAISRQLSDHDALELQILENLQREDPHPMEEAEGYEQLMLTHGYSADQLAERLKKSRSYIYGRLKLCALTTEVRERFLDNIEELNASTALLIARIPVPSLQVQALNEVLQPNGPGSEPMSHRRARDHLQNKYTLDLGEAPFSVKDSKLLAAAGSCAKCPKRTGNQPEIYADAKSADVCTDPDCFAEKKAAHYASIVVHANKKGIPVLEGDEAADATPHDWSRDEKFVTTDHHLSAFDRVAPATGMSGTVKKYLAAADMPAPAKYIKDADGTLEPLYRRQDIQAALEKVGACESEQVRSARLAAETADPTKVVKLTKQQEAAVKRNQEEEERQRRCDAITKERVIRYRKLRARAASGLTLPMLRELVKALVLDSPDHCLPDDLLGDLYPFQHQSDAALCAHIDQADLASVQLLLMDLIVGESLSMSTWDLDDDPSPTALAVLAMAKEEGIDVTPADLVVANIDIESLQEWYHILDVLADNEEHLAAICAYIVDKAPHHLSNVEQAANHLGYAYGSGGWHKKLDQVADANTSAESPAQSEDGDVTPAAPQKKTLSLKGTKKAPAKESSEQNDGPQIKVKKSRTVLGPPAAWPFPTQCRQ